MDDEGCTEKTKISEDEGTVELVDDALKFTTFVINCFGCIGNTLSLVVLTRNRLRRSVDPQEHTVYTGLLSITVSDLLFCITIVPSVAINQHQVVFQSPLSFRLAYNVYGMGLMTTFSLLSTWFVVATAGIRYLGICHPLRARYIIQRSTTTILFILVIVACVGLNLPSFWTTKVVSVSLEDCHFYIVDLGMFSHETALGTSFMIVRFIIGVIVPFVLLIFFNCRLVMALRRSERFRKSHRPHYSRQDAASHQLENTQTTFATTHCGLNKQHSRLSPGDKRNAKTNDGVRCSARGENNLQGFNEESRCDTIQRNKADVASANCGPVVVKQVRIIKKKRSCCLSSKRHQNNRMTIILISMTFFFIILVLPSEVEDFLPKIWSRIDALKEQNFDEFSTNFSSFEGPHQHQILNSRQITNLMHVFMFSCNFLFYTFLSSHFRQAFLIMVRSCCCRWSSVGDFFSSQQFYVVLSILSVCSKQ